MEEHHPEAASSSGGGSSSAAAVLPELPPLTNITEATGPEENILPTNLLENAMLQLKEVVQSMETSRGNGHGSTSSSSSSSTTEEEEADYGGEEGEKEGPLSYMD